MNAGDPFPGGDDETNHRALEATELLRWCAQHPSTSTRAEELTRQLDALSMEWCGGSGYERARGRLRYYDRTGSILYDARCLAGLSPHGEAVID